MKTPVKKPWVFFFAGAHCKEQTKLGHLWIEVGFFKGQHGAPSYIALRKTPQS